MFSSRRNFLKTIGASGALAALPKSLVSSPSTFSADQPSLQARLAADPLRPQFHLLPARNWMNDPNGPIFWQGNYHMFFQYNPNAAVWGDMHWAHAVSKDMIHWKHLPIALAPTSGSYDQDGCFSGSAVDYNGTATFLYTGVKSVPPEQASLRDGTHNFLESQCLATSSDPDLRNWTKLPAPVLLPPKDPQLTGFRDPCLWHDGETWYMGVGSGQRGRGGCVLLYRSTDLRHWEYLHTLASGKWNGKQTPNVVDSGEMWECPDFFSFGKKHLLLYSTEGKVYWETGELDPKELVFHPEKNGRLDYGSFYAPKSQLDEKGNRILWAWIPETRPEAEFSAAGWAGCMSLPRVLTLDQKGELQMRVVPAASQLRAHKISLPGAASTMQARVQAMQSIQIKAAAVELHIRFSSKPFHLVLTDGKDPLLSFSFEPDRQDRQLQLDKLSAPLNAGASADHELRLFLDASVIECFVDDSVALTGRCYSVPSGPLRLVIPEPELPAITELSLWEMRPISPDRLTT
jgi:beta-fructofuranosidase